MIDTPKPRRGRPRTLDADKVLDSALEAYWTEDPADLSLNAICARAGVSKPALYRQFGGEDGLMRAVLDRYAEAVLSETFELLDRNLPLADTLAALIDFAGDDPRMETGCLFYKMRAGKHRLGPGTRARVEEFEAAAVAAYAGYLEGRRRAGDWPAHQPAEIAARYIVEQVGLALTQRASGEEAPRIRTTLSLALSVIGGP